MLLLVDDGPTLWGVSARHSADTPLMFSGEANNCDFFAERFF
jgi:hypothetical protein